MKQTCRILVEQYDGRVPATMEELLTLPGVGRKTANLVLILSFQSLKNICVDTHVHRISNRLGWVKTRTPEETEHALYGGTHERWWPVHQPVSGDVGTERLPSDLPALRGVRHQSRTVAQIGVTRVAKSMNAQEPRSARFAEKWFIALASFSARAASSCRAAGGPGDGRGNDEGHVSIRDVSRRRAEDRRARRRLVREERFLRRPTGPSRTAGASSSNGAIRGPPIVAQTPTGAAGPTRPAATRSACLKFRKKRSTRSERSAIAHQGTPALADSQIYITLANRPDLNGKYAVFGHVIEGDDVPRTPGPRRPNQPDLREGSERRRSRRTTPATCG